MKTQLFTQYVELENQISLLEDKKSEIRDKCLEEMKKEDVEKVQSDFGTFSITERKTWIYSKTALDNIKKLDEQSKLIKEKDQESGKAKVEINQSLKISKNKTMKFKVGDKVQVISSYYNWGKINHGDIGIIDCILNTWDDYSDIIVNFPNQSHWFGKKENLKLIYSAENSDTSIYEKEYKVEFKTMDIKDQFLLAITSEPQKSFRKARITNGDNLLTEDGQKVFLSWLLSKHQDEFKKEVVDPILEDIKNEKK